MATETTYADEIRGHLKAAGREDVNARHVKAYMTIEYGTLDHMGAEAFDRAVAMAVAEIDLDGADMAEKVAQSCGY